MVSLIQRNKELLRGFLAIPLIFVGITHFTAADQYARIVPPPFPPFASVYLSGVFEILGGIGLLVPWVSVLAAWGVVSLFIAVYPANIYMALHMIKLDHVPQSPVLYWLRLPFQAVLIAWAYWYTRQPEAQVGAQEASEVVKEYGQ